MDFSTSLPADVPADVYQAARTRLVPVLARKARDLIPMLFPPEEIRELYAVEAASEEEALKTWSDG